MSTSAVACFWRALLVSLLVLLVGIWLVLGLWYPRPFWAATGVLTLGAYAMVVHLGISALLVLPWRNRLKAGRRNSSDVVAILWMLVTAALFSLSILASARPVALVHVVDRVSLVRAHQIRTTELALPSLAVRGLRWSGPLPLLKAQLSSDMERFEAVQLAMKGFDLAQRPSRWATWSIEPTELGHGLSRAWPMPLDGVRGEWVLAFDAGTRAYVPHRAN